jgi:hypothetical protein
VDVGPQLERRLGGQLLGMLGPVWGLVLQVGANGLGCVSLPGWALACGHVGMAA